MVDQPKQPKRSKRVRIAQGLQTMYNTRTLGPGLALGDAIAIIYMLEEMGYKVVKMDKHKGD